MKRLLVALVVGLYIFFMIKYIDNTFLYILVSLPLLAFGWVNKEKLK